MDERSERLDRILQRWDKLPEHVREGVMSAPPLSSEDMAQVRAWLPPVTHRPVEAPGLDAAA